MALDESIIERLTLQQINVIWAFKLVNCNTSHAAKVMHLNYGAMYKAMNSVKDATGLNPHDPYQLEKLYNSVENYRKEKMNGRPFDIGEYFFGKCSTP